MADSDRKREDWFVCPHCGAEVAASAKSCPECGSDADTGWSEDADKWGAGIPTGYGEEDEFDYDEWLRRELGGGRRILGLTRWMAICLALLLALLVLGLSLLAG